MTYCFAALEGASGSGIPPPVGGGNMFGGPPAPYKRGPPQEYLDAINKKQVEDVSIPVHMYDSCSFAMQKNIILSCV